VSSYVQKALRSFADSLAYEGFVGKLYCKLAFRGIVSPDFNLRKALTFDQLEAWDFPIIESIEISPLGEYDDMTEMDLDLDDLSRGKGPKALLARKLLDKEQLSVLVGETQSIIRESLDFNSFALVREIEGIENALDAEQLSRKAAVQILRSMIRQGGQNG
jgi:hypothetical protein